MTFEFSPSYEVAPPILVVGFNRPDLLQVTLNRIKDCKVGRLFISIDGPRGSHPTDHDLVARSRVIAESIDWAEELHLNFYEENLGCQKAVSGALNWFFSAVENGIVVEDDVLIDPSFVALCSWGLKRFEQELTVGFISGCNFVPQEFCPKTSSIRFNSVPHVTGWATWHRVWKNFELPTDSTWPSKLSFLNLTRRSNWSLSASLYWFLRFQEVRLQRVNTWDYALVRMAYLHDLLTMSPNINLAQHIGWRSDATHTTSSAPAYEQELASFGTVLTWNDEIKLDNPSEEWTRRYVYGITWKFLVKSIALLLLNKWNQTASKSPWDRNR